VLEINSYGVFAVLHATCREVACDQKNRIAYVGLGLTQGEEMGVPTMQRPEEAHIDNTSWISRPPSRILVDPAEGFLDEQLIAVANIAASMVEDYPAELRKEIAYCFHQELLLSLLTDSIWPQGD
jgi:hypothetical protein